MLLHVLAYVNHIRLRIATKWQLSIHVVLLWWESTVGVMESRDARRNADSVAMPDQGIAYCGLHCEECFAHKGTIADMSRDLRAELRKAKFDRVAGALAEGHYFEVFENYADAYEVLGALVKLRCRNMCKGGGGPPFCRIRKCSQKKGYSGCWECNDFADCDKLRTLEGAHKDAHIKNLRRIRRAGVEGFLAGAKQW